MNNTLPKSSAVTKVFVAMVMMKVSPWGRGAEHSDGYVYAFERKGHEKRPFVARNKRRLLSITFVSFYLFLL